MLPPLLLNEDLIIAQAMGLNTILSLTFVFEYNLERFINSLFEHWVRPMGRQGQLQGSSRPLEG